MKKTRLELARAEYDRWYDKREDAIATLVKCAKKLPQIGRRIAKLQKLERKKAELLLRPNLLPEDPIELVSDLTGVPHH